MWTLSTNYQVTPSPLSVSHLKYIKYYNNFTFTAMSTITAVKAVKQCYTSTPELLQMMETFRMMVNDCIRIGIVNDTSTLKRLSKLSYHVLTKYDIYSRYRLCAISKAAGILTNRKKSIKRGYKSKDPYLQIPLLIAYLGFKVSDGILRVPFGNRQYFNIQLNSHVKAILGNKDIRIRSFTITSNSLSVCYSKEVELCQPQGTIGIDRNLENVTVGNYMYIIQYNLSKAVKIAENSRSVMRSFKRNDARVRKQLAMKHGQRKCNRIRQLLHKASRSIIHQAKQQKSAIVFEDIKRIRGLYLHGNFQSRNHRTKMNSWPYYELERQVKYKAAWEGVLTIQLSKSETRGTSKLCPQCGERTQEAIHGDRQHYRQIWCQSCKLWQDRDIVAAMNIACRGRAFLSNSGKGVFERPQGGAEEAMVQESASKEVVILKVDASKLTVGRVSR